MTGSTPPTGWTPERVAELTRLWADGLSAAQIARSMGGITRNAVIGKVHRMGLSGRAKPAAPKRFVKPSRPRALKAVEPAPAYRMEVPDIAQPPGGFGVDKMGRFVDRAASKPIDALRVLDSIVPPKGIMELARGECRYPVNDGDHPVMGWLFCSAPVKGEGPWCIGHHSICINENTTLAKMRIKPSHGAQCGRAPHAEFGFGG